MSQDASLRMQTLLSWADRVVEEYLLFRGFIQAHRSFLQETKNDRLHEFQVEKIVEELLRLLTSFQYQAMMDLWFFLQERFFTRMSSKFWAVMKHLECSLQRFYLVNACQSDRMDKVKEVLETEAESFRSVKDWEIWFQLPYVKDPASDAAFQVYFTKEWASQLVVSVHNLLATVFHEVAVPAILQCYLNLTKIDKLEKQVKDLTRQNQALKDELVSSRSNPSSTLNPSDSVEQTPLPTAARLEEQEKLDLLDLSTAFASSLKESMESQGRPDEQDYKTLASNDPDAQGSDRGAGDSMRSLYDVVNERVFPGHSSSVLCCRFSGDGGNFASSSQDLSVRIQVLPNARAAQMERSATIFLSSPALTLSWEKRYDRLLLMGTAKGELKAWDADTKNMAFETSADKQNAQMINLSPNPDGSSVVAVCSNKQSTWSQLQVFSLRGGKKTQVLDAKEGFNYRGIDHNHNGSLLAVSANNLIQLKDLSTIMEWKAHDAAISCVKFGYDETTIISAGADGYVKEWSAHSPGKELFSQRMISGDEEAIMDVALSPIGRHVIACSGNYVAAHLIDPLDSRLQQVGEQQSTISCVDWSQDQGNVTILTGSVEGLVKVVGLAAL
ncbi:hypothetical protein GUITHDRAFT_132936 [Guillardia theta CCMP2712]|uniref:ARMC9 CTLH-like domain-containing protein n=1 Tax=Guillardia theta (strain CCMP2712) TaxID=905079 RepID=L1JX59_GUITC|nr:hypothetical protein GUITHDRAFT_132936 [Guillardia theta CCMP2712]EKX53171.1 hypothetical protein GUITHDRAFT_132936 [Guillardia theta CCMP2712]|eukprot:XP_005840151.1 hypothetical protein GUITHDRAFT_132936 [Guillardia theta CCMP2712]